MLRLEGSFAGAFTLPPLGLLADLEAMTDLSTSSSPEELVQHVVSLRKATASNFANVSEFLTLVATRVSDPAFARSVLSLLSTHYPNLEEMLHQFDASPHLLAQHDVAAIASGVARQVSDDADDRARVLREVKDEAIRIAQGFQHIGEGILVFSGRHAFDIFKQEAFGCLHMDVVVDVGKDAATSLPIICALREACC
jgi:hypothetical protein